MRDCVTLFLVDISMLYLLDQRSPLRGFSSVVSDKDGWLQALKVIVTDKSLHHELDGIFGSWWQNNSHNLHLYLQPLTEQLNKKYEIYSHGNNDIGGFCSILSQEQFLKVRRDVVKNACKRLYISGSSLYRAFDHDSDEFSPDSIYRELFQILANPEMMNLQVKIYLTDPMMFEKERVDSESRIPWDSPFKRIKRTLESILLLVANICDLQVESFKIFFIPLLQLDHIVIADDVLLLRHTMLWDKGGNFKASFMMCCNSEKQESINNNIPNMYSAYFNYLDELVKSSVVIDRHMAAEESQRLWNNPKDRFIRMWRHQIYDNDKQGRVSIYRVYRKLILKNVLDRWEHPEKPQSNITTFPTPVPESTFIHGQHIGKYEELFDPSHLLGDETQTILLPYISETEQLLNDVVKKLDSSRGYAKIFPSLDLGVPNNTQRLAGGFATGMVVTWRCGVPVIPIDATVNICSSTIVEINDSLCNSISSDILHSIFAEAGKAGRVSSFSSGNHFLTICTDRQENKYYLVLHSSAKEYKYGPLGLYPHPTSRFAENIKTVSSERDGSRYLRYIKDDVAEDFIKIALTLDSGNVAIHEYFVDKICGKNTKGSIQTHHHYYMPNDYTIAIGTYLVELHRDEGMNAVLPIFSCYGKPIKLFRPNNKSWKMLVDGKYYAVVPHGWGQSFAKEINGFQLIGNNKDRKIKILDNTIKVSCDSSFGEHPDMVSVRDISWEKFMQSPFLQGEWVTTLDQVVSYSKYGFRRHV